MSPSKKKPGHYESAQKIPFMTKGLVDLYDHFSSTQGLSIDELNRRLKRARDFLGHGEPDSFRFTKGTNNGWKNRAMSEPSDTRPLSKEIAEGCLLAFQVDLTQDGIFHSEPLVLNKQLIEMGPVLLRKGQTNSVSEDGVQAHHVVISHLKGQVARFPVKGPHDQKIVGYVRIKPEKITIEFSIDGFSAKLDTEDLEIVRGTVRPLLGGQLPEGDHENGASVNQCTFETTANPTKFKMLRKLEAPAEASAILRKVVPLSMDIGPDDEITIFVTIAEDDLAPAEFTSVDNDWDEQKSRIFERFYKLDRGSEERLLALSKARPSQ